MLTKKNRKPIDYCRNILPKVSRSFALTIPLMDSEIREEVMITYLIDRLLDSFEDEGEIAIKTRKEYMDKVVSVFDPQTEVEESLIKDIKKMAVYFDNSIRQLVKNIDKLASCFNTFDNDIKEISYRWLDEMKIGMKEYLDKEVKTFNQLNEYCYYVAGTVGGFLTDLIIEKIKVSKKNKKILEKNFVESGLFLQKINIIRDIKTDIINQKKHYWPLEELNITEDKLIDKKYQDQALIALNKMVSNVKRHSDALINYYHAVPDRLSGYKKFYSVNNAMGYSTLRLIENNPDLFYSNQKLKIKKKEVLKILAVSESSFLDSANLVLSKR